MDLFERVPPAYFKPSQSYKLKLEKQNVKTKLKPLANPLHHRKHEIGGSVAPGPCLAQRTFNLESQWTVEPDLGAIKKKNTVATAVKHGPSDLPR